MLTTEPNVLLGIETADCVPILLVVPPKRGERGNVPSNRDKKLDTFPLLGALHAGWRGTQKAIALRAVQRCAEQWDLAPTQRWGDGQPTTWNRQGDKGYLDLRAINRMQFIQAGVPQTQIHYVGPCTFCHPDEFTSYRREGAQAGRQLSVIGWRPK